MNTANGSFVWQRGKFHKFYAQMKIRVGGAAVPIDIHAGDEFEFDGTVLKYGGGEYTSQQTRGAVDMGWATLTQDSEAPVRSRASNRSVAKATSVNRDLSRVQRHEANHMDMDMSDEDTVMVVSDRRQSGQGARTLNVSHDRAAPRILTASGQQRMAINDDVMDAQGGVSVGRVRTPAKMKADVLTSHGASMASALNNISGSGFVPHGSSQARGHNVIHREGISVRTNVSSGRILGVEQSEQDEARVVGRVRKSQTRTAEGIEIIDTSNIREERARKPVKVQKAVSKPVAAPKISPKLVAAQAIFPKFPEDWNFVAKVADRIERVKKGPKDKKFLLAVYAVEGAEVKKFLEKTYPKMFGG